MVDAWKWTHVAAVIPLQVVISKVVRRHTTMQSTWILRFLRVIHLQTHEKGKRRNIIAVGAGKATRSSSGFHRCQLQQWKEKNRVANGEGRVCFGVFLERGGCQVAGGRGIGETRRNIETLWSCFSLSSGFEDFGIPVIGGRGNRDPGARNSDVWTAEANSCESSDKGYGYARPRGRAARGQQGAPGRTIFNRESTSLVSKPYS